MTNETPPFSRPIRLADVPANGCGMVIRADEREREALAKLFALPAISTLEAELSVSPFGKAGLAVSGEIHANLTQTCVVTLEDFESDLVAPVAVRFLPQEQDPKAGAGLTELIDPDAEDPPDPMVGGSIDLGVVVSEFLALSLPPHPRKPGVAFAGHGEAEAPSSFEALAALRKTR
jgi:hypothetical protein